MWSAKFFTHVSVSPINRINNSKNWDLSLIFYLLHGTDVVKINGQPTILGMWKTLEAYKG